MTEAAALRSHHSFQGDFETDTFLVTGALQANPKAAGSTFAQDVADPLCAGEQRAYTHEGAGTFRTRNVTAFSCKDHGQDVGMVVRRLTPTECERLQAFTDGYTNITYRGSEAKDGPRYKALGNAMCCDVMAWIGRRIDAARRA